MLVPALVHKEELLKKFAKEIYSERFFYYSGYGHCHGIPNIAETDNDNIYQWAILSNDKVIGWLAYRVYTDTKSVENFGLYAFEDEDYSIQRNALALGRDVYNKIHELAEIYHRVSWRVIGGNPVIRSYNAICKEFSNKENYYVNSVQLTDVTVDAKGQYHDEVIYEIINKGV